MNETKKKKKKSRLADVYFEEILRQRKKKEIDHIH